MVGCIRSGELRRTSVSINKQCPGMVPVTTAPGRCYRTKLEKAAQKEETGD